jgi:4-hydroxybenzoate polyprenyltransferase
MAAFLFLIMLTIDLIKDVLTSNVDRVFGYNTIANVFGKKVSYIVIGFVIFANVWFLFYCFSSHPENQLYVRLLFIKYSFFRNDEFSYSYLSKI